MRILCYLKGSLGQGIFMPSQNPLNLHVYCDSDWGNCPMSRKSVTGYLVKPGLAPIAWKT